VDSLPHRRRRHRHRVLHSLTVAALIRRPHRLPPSLAVAARTTSPLLQRHPSALQSTSIYCCSTSISTR
jgi:hypothetical protein